MRKRELQQAVAVAEPTTSTSVNVALNFEEDAGRGLEGTDKTSFAIPFITVLQGLSPQIETVDGAKPGLFINTITNELSRELLVVPCAFQRRFIRWAPRASGGGYKGEYSPAEVETGKLEGLSMHEGTYMMDVPVGAQAFDSKGLPLFDHLSDTRNHFCLVQSATGAWQPALLSLSSTQIKKSKRWLSRIQGLEMHKADGSSFVPPSFSHIYSLNAVKEENAKGAWWGLTVDLVEPVGDSSLYAKAKAFHKQVAEGTVEVQPRERQEPVGEGEEKF